MDFTNRRTRTTPTRRLGALVPSVSLAGALVLGTAIAACGSSQPRHEHPEPLSVDEHYKYAEAHDGDAASYRENAEPGAGEPAVECVDIGGPLESGGESMRVMKPCWTSAEQNAAYMRAADAQSKAAAEHRHWARLLVDVEKTACAGIGANERTTSPFVRSPDILSVEEYRESGHLMGARITFRKVKGLSKAWLTRSIRCHQARAAKVGYSEDFMSHCPLVLQKTGSSVSETGDKVVVTLRSTDPIIAAAIYGRSLGASDESD